MTYRNRRTDDGNHSPCPGCGSLVYWRDGPYCGSCQSLPSRHCFECNRDNRTAGRVCHGCEAQLPLAPVFGFDRLSGNPWVTRPPQVSYVTSNEAWARFIRKAKADCPDLRRPRRSLLAPRSHYWGLRRTDQLGPAPKGWTIIPGLED
jgi:hypothetical protein